MSGARCVQWERAPTASAPAGKFHTLCLLLREPRKVPNDCCTDSQRFQGMINMDNQRIQLVITNLCPEASLNFNILHASGAGVNKVNCLPPLSSYAVQADQAMEGRALILAALEDSNKLTVKQDEQEVSSGKKNSLSGSSFSLSVIPQADQPELAARFARTVWRCRENFVLQRNEPLLPPSYPTMFSFCGTGRPERSLLQVILIYLASLSALTLFAAVQ